jgi:hypothetical protein
MLSRREELKASWSRSRGHLENAFAQLSPTAAETFHEFIEHNELELALEELERLGDATSAKGLFWESMLKAALEMKLDGHAARYGERAAG